MYLRYREDATKDEIMKAQRMQRRKNPEMSKRSTKVHPRRLEWKEVGSTGDFLGQPSRSTDVKAQGLLLVLKSNFEVLWHSKLL